MAGFLGGLAGGIGSALVGGLLGGASGGGSSGGGGTTEIINVPWEGIQPYLVGDSEYRPNTELPLSSDWLWWNYMQGQGMPVGPPPPMFVNDPRYTGQGVYDAPFQFQPARTTGPAYGDQGPFGAGIPSTPGIDPSQGYPSGRPDGGGTVPAPTAPAAPAPAAPEKQEGLSDLDKYILRKAKQDWASRWAADPEASLMGNYVDASMGLLSPEGRSYIRGLPSQMTPEGADIWRGLLR